MSHKQIELEFKQSLSETDYGLIVSSEGALKGIWIPVGKEDNEIPDAIVSLCIARFGINPNGTGHQAVLQ
jgi:hypothetical protein